MPLAAAAAALRLMRRHCLLHGALYGHYRFTLLPLSDYFSPC